jgi:FkbM family methyltransferase
MRNPQSHSTIGQWREVARVIHRTIQPTGKTNLVGTEFVLRSEARPKQVDRDYAFLRAMATGKHYILDVGANLGLTALVMANAMANDGQLVAFETAEVGCRTISDHIVLNDLEDRILVVNALIAERSGMIIDFYGGNASGGSSIVPGYLGHVHSLRKATLALDDFVANNGCSPDFIKIDVEGAEARVLSGLKETLFKIRPLVFVELHSWQDNTVPDMAAQIMDQLNSVSYCMVYLKTKSVVEDPAALMGRGRCHVLLCPIESPILTQLELLDTKGL